MGGLREERGENNRKKCLHVSPCHVTKHKTTRVSSSHLINPLQHTTAAINTLKKKWISTETHRFYRPEGPAGRIRG